MHGVYIRNVYMLQHIYLFIIMYVVCENELTCLVYIMSSDIIIGIIMSTILLDPGTENTMHAL